MAGENAIFKRRGDELPSSFSSGLKPKRINFVMDVSGRQFSLLLDRLALGKRTD